jgi:peptidase S41-like protein
MSAAFLSCRRGIAAAALSSLALACGPIEKLPTTPPPPGPARGATFDPAASLADYAFLKAALERGYANLAWFGAPEGGVDLPALDRRTLAALTQAHDAADARQAMLAFVAGFHDGHFAELPYLATSSGAVLEPPERVLDPEDATAGCAALGYVVSPRVAFSLPFETLSSVRLDSDGQSRSFRSAIATTAAGARLGIVRIESFSQTQYPAECLRAWATVRKAGRTIARKDIDDEARKGWYEALAAQLDRFKARGVSAVIVDVGANGGGNDSGDWTARLLTGKPVHSARLLVATAPTSSGYFEEQKSDLTEALKTNPGAEARHRLEEALVMFQRGEASLGAQPCDLTWVWREKRSWTGTHCKRLTDAGSAGGALDYLPRSALVAGDESAKRLHWPLQVADFWGAWTGPVYVLTDGKSFSSAEMFAAVMHDNGIARTVGVKTGGDGCGWMAPVVPIVLPASRLRFRVPSCARLRADGTDEVSGVAPDLPVAATEGESSRARAARVLTAVERDLKP